MCRDCVAAELRAGGAVPPPPARIRACIWDHIDHSHLRFQTSAGQPISPWFQVPLTLQDLLSLLPPHEFYVHVHPPNVPDTAALRRIGYPTSPPSTAANPPYYSGQLVPGVPLLAPPPPVYFQAVPPGFSAAHMPVVGQQQVAFQEPPETPASAGEERESALAPHLEQHVAFDVPEEDEVQTPGESPPPPPPLYSSQLSLDSQGMSLGTSLSASRSSRSTRSSRRYYHSGRFLRTASRVDALSSPISGVSSLSGSSHSLVGSLETPYVYAPELPSWEEQRPQQQAVSFPGQEGHQAPAPGSYVVTQGTHNTPADATTRDGDGLPHVGEPPQGQAGSHSPYAMAHQQPDHAYAPAQQFFTPTYPQQYPYYYPHYNPTYLMAAEASAMGLQQPPPMPIVDFLRPPPAQDADIELFDGDDNQSHHSETQTSGIDEATAATLLECHPIFSKLTVPEADQICQICFDCTNEAPDTSGMPEDRASTLWTTPRSPVANTRHCAQFQPTSPSGQSTPLLSPVDATRTMASADEHGSMDVSQCHPRQGEDQGRGTPSTLTRTAHQADQAAGSEGRAQGTPDEESVGSRSCSAESTKSGGLRLTLPCGHTFHRECLGQWLLRSRSCPTCRFDLTEASVHKAAHTARAFAALPDTSSGWARFLRTTMENHEGATVEDTAAGH